MTRLDIEKFFVGFDNMINSPLYPAQPQTYPRYNIKKVKEEGYQIQVAVPGWKKDQVTVTLVDHTLTIKGEKKDHDGDACWIHKGISGKSFERHLKLDDSLEVSSASMEDGMLYIDLVYAEAAKPKVIQIA